MIIKFNFFPVALIREKNKQTKKIIGGYWFDLSLVDYYLFPIYILDLDIFYMVEL